MLTLNVVPPGHYFVESGGSGNASWQMPVTANAGSLDYLPITKGERHRIEKISFTDQLGTRWTWTPVDGIVRGG